MYTIKTEKVVNGFNVREAAWEGFDLQLLLAPNAPRGGDYLPARVTKGGQELWSFKRSHPYYRGLAQLIEYGDELVIALSTRFAIDLVIPVRDLPHIKMVGNEHVGGRKLKEIVSMKQDIAESFGREPAWTKREADMLRALEQAAAAEHAEATKHAKAEREAARLAEEERREHERAEREARRAVILGRKKVVAYTASGDRRFGTPVVGDEWMVLRDGAFCITVSSFNEKTGEVGDPIESFAVTKQGGGKAGKRSVAEVFWENQKPATASKEVIEIKTVVMKVHGELEEVIITESIEQVKALCAQGLNSGTLAMAPKANEPDRYVIYRLEGGKYGTVTEVVRVKRC